MKKIFLTVLLLLLVAITGSVFAETTNAATVSGRVFDQTTGQNLSILVGKVVETCPAAGRRNPTVQADGTFSFQIDAGIQFCVRGPGSSNPTGTFSGYQLAIPGAAVNRVSGGAANTYEYQIAGFNCFNNPTAHPQCTEHLPGQSDPTKQDRSVNTGYDIAYRPVGASAAPSATAAPTATAVPTSNPTSTPVATPTPTTQPTTAPTPIPGVTLVSIDLAEDQNITINVVQKLPSQVTFDSNGNILTDYTFSNPKPGIKTLCARFNPSSGAPIVECRNIELVGGDPIITETNCTRNADGTLGVVFNGNNLGVAPGKVNSSTVDKDLTVDNGNWNQDADGKSIVQGNLSGVSAENEFVFILTRFDGKTANSSCNLNNAEISLGTDYYCPVFKGHTENNVKMTVYDSQTGSVLDNETVSIDSKGVVKGITQKFEEGKWYTLSIKPLKGVTKFTRVRGSNIPGNSVNVNLNLPIGDIAPSGSGDGQINGLDGSLLRNQWGAGTATRSADLNADASVNSFDWSCMLTSFGSAKGSEDPLPTFPDIPEGETNLSSPSPSPEISATPSATPSI